MRPVVLLRLALLLLVLHPPPALAADDTGVMRYIYPPPESPDDRRLDFRLAVLRNALDRTRDRYGPYALEPAADVMSPHRQVAALRNDTGQLTVIHRSTSPDLERDLTPIRIPVDRGLTGFRVFLVRRQDLPRFAAVRTLDDLRRFSYGAEVYWIDVDVLRASDFRIVTGSDYDGLFNMLANRRFDAFPRGVNEVIPEFAERRGLIPDLAVEPTLCLYYPLPQYFWFPKTPAGRRLADRVRDGMTAMLADGTYDRLFFAHFGPALAQLDLPHRRILRIDNPYVTPATILTNPRYWFDPTTQPLLPPPPTRPAARH